MIQQTSLMAYRSLKLAPRQKDVLHAIKEMGVCSNLEISKYLKLPINSITGRTNELRKKNLVSGKGFMICKYTKNKVIAWMVSTGNEGV